MPDGPEEPAGQATTPDGSISVTCTDADPVHELYIHPAATRWSVYDLAYAVQETVRGARVDLDEQRAAQRDDEEGDAQPADVHTAMTELRELSDLAGRGGDDAVFAEMRRRLGVQ